jgi:hypothetical protein
MFKVYNDQMELLRRFQHVPAGQATLYARTVAVQDNSVVYVYKEDFPQDIFIAMCHPANSAPLHRLTNRDTLVSQNPVFMDWDLTPEEIECLKAIANG